MRLQRSRQKMISEKMIVVLLLTILVFSIFSSQSLAVDKDTQEVSEQSQQSQTGLQVQDLLQCLTAGKELFWEQKYSEAVKQLESCAENDPDNPEIYYYIAQSYFQQGQRSTLRAVRYFRQAFDASEIAVEKYWLRIETQPEEDHTNDYLQLAYIYQIRSLIPDVDEFGKALEIYQKLLIEKPYILSAYYHMGWIYYQQEDYSKAIETYLEYLKTGTKNDFVYYYLGLSYDKIGERQKAEEYFQLVLEEFPDTEIARLAQKELR